MSDDLIEIIFVIWSLIGSIRFSFRSNFRSIRAIFCVENTSNSVFQKIVSWVRKGFLLLKWVKIFSRPFYVVFVFTRRNKNYHLQKMRFFWQIALFLIGSMIGIWSEFLSKVWSVIRSGHLFFWKIGIGAEIKKKLDLVQPWL